MGRTASPNSRHTTVGVRLSDRELRSLDAHRGGMSRVAYLRWCLAQQVLPAASRATHTDRD